MKDKLLMSATGEVIAYPLRRPDANKLTECETTNPETAAKPNPPRE